MTTVKTEIKPSLDVIKARFKKRLDKLKNAHPAYKKAAVYLDRWVQTNFKTEGGNVGGWLPLKAGGRYGPKGFDTTASVLQDTGRLRLSFLPFATNKNAGIGSDLLYSRTHDRGDDGVPQRRMLPKRDEVIDGLHDILDGHVKDSIK